MLHIPQSVASVIFSVCPQQLQRRAYWLLDTSEDEDLVLVHYLHVAKPSQLAINDPSESSTPAHMSPRAAMPSSLQPDQSSTDQSSQPGSAGGHSNGQAHNPPKQPFHESQQQQQQDGEALLQDAARASDGTSASSASPMMLDAQQPSQSIPPDPYMPLLPSMSLDSFFMAVDEQHCQPLRPLLPSNGSIDPFNNLDELAVEPPMSSLTLSGTDWRVRFEASLHNALQNRTRAASASLQALPYA